MLDQAQLDFVNNYNGPIRFITAVKTSLANGQALTDRQVKYTTTLINNIKAGKDYSKKEKENKPIAKQELFTLENMQDTLLETPKEKETPLLSNIEETLNKLAGKVVEESMRNADTKINALLAKVTQLTANNSKIMHVKLGNNEVKKLTNEAHELLPALLVACNYRHNPVLVGPMGCGKTTFAAQIAEAMGLRFGHIGLTAGASETWLFGRQTPTGFKEAQFSDFYRNGGVFLLDEIDAADSNLLISMNCALANGSMYNPILGEEIKRHKDFVCIAAANTFGLGATAVYTGRNRLDGATLDRFPIFEVNYNEKLEAKLCPNKKIFDKLQKARKKLANRNATQVISTRQFQRVAQYIEAGMDETLAINTFAAAWPKGLAEEIGLFSKEKEVSNEIPF